MKLIEKRMRDIVLNINAEGSEERKRIICDLNGISYDFFKMYLPVAQFEKRFFENNCYINGMNTFMRPEDLMSLNLNVYDPVVQEINDYNASFGYRYVQPRRGAEISIEIPFNCFSEWTVLILRKFDAAFNNSMAYYEPDVDPEKLEDGQITRMFKNLVEQM